MGRGVSSVNQRPEYQGVVKQSDLRELMAQYDQCRVEWSATFLSPASSYTQDGLASEVVVTQLSDRLMDLQHRILHAKFRLS